MKENTIIADGNIEIYENSIFQLADEYISHLSDDEDEKKELIRKPMAFRGLLKYIYVNLFKATSTEVKHNRNSKIDYDNIDALNTIWDIYTSLCYKYLNAPSILGFSLLTGISMSTFNDWKNGTYRAKSKEYLQSYKRWRSEAEGAAADIALRGGIGGIFTLKACYGYFETPQIDTNTPVIAIENPQQITQRRAGEKPDFPQEIE